MTDSKQKFLPSCNKSETLDGITILEKLLNYLSFVKDKRLMSLSLKSIKLIDTTTTRHFRVWSYDFKRVPSINSLIVFLHNTMIFNRFNLAYFV